MPMQLASPANGKWFFASATFPKSTQLDLPGVMSDPTLKPMQLALLRPTQLVSPAVGLRALLVLKASACMTMQLALPANGKQFFPSATFPKLTQLDLPGMMSDPTPKLMQLVLLRPMQLVSLAIGLQAMPVLKATACMPMQLALLANRKWVKAVPKAPIPKLTQLVLPADGKQAEAIPKAQLHQWTTPWKTHAPLTRMSTMTTGMNTTKLTPPSPPVVPRHGTQDNGCLTPHQHQPRLGPCSIGTHLPPTTSKILMPFISTGWTSWMKAPSPSTKKLLRTSTTLMPPLLCSSSCPHGPTPSKLCMALNK